MDYLAFGFSDGVGSRSSLSLQNGDQPIERRTSRLWINKLTGRVDDEPASLPARPSRLTPARSFPPVAVGLEDGRRTTQSPPRRLSTVVSDPSAQSGQSLDGDLRNRLAACEEALDAVQTRLATIEAQVHGVDDDELEDVSDANWARATRAVTDLDRQVAALRRRLPPLDGVDAPRDEPPPRPARAGWACCNLFGRPELPRPTSLDRITPFNERQAPTPASDLRSLDASPDAAPVRGRRGFSGRFEPSPNLSEQLAQFSPKAPSPAKSLFSRTLPKTSPLSTPGTSQEAHPPTPPLTPPLTPPEGTQTKPQFVVGRWLPPYGQEAPL